MIRRAIRSRRWSRSPTRTAPGHGLIAGDAPVRARRQTALTGGAAEHRRELRCHDEVHAVVAPGRRSLPAGIISPCSVPTTGDGRPPRGEPRGHAAEASPGGPGDLRAPGGPRTGGGPLAGGETAGRTARPAWLDGPSRNTAPRDSSRWTDLPAGAYLHWAACRRWSSRRGALAPRPRARVRPAAGLAGLLPPGLAAFPDVVDRRLPHRGAARWRDDTDALDAWRAGPDRRTPSSTPACASSPPRAGCTTGPG